MPACPNCRADNPDGFRFCGACGAALAPAEPARGEVRKTVTIVFCDVSGSTALGERLDPEATRSVMGRYFEAMRGVLERHGGTVEKFIGDAVMAVFGVPVLHEDDGLRAVRAASEMQEALAELNQELERDFGLSLQMRIGVNTGEVVSGDAAQTLVTGDAVNTAARLEQAAKPGEILLGEPTYRLVRDAVEADPAERLTVKGKEKPLAAVRLRGLVAGAEAFVRRFESPLVGRKRELSLLQQAYQRAVDERACHLFTILGSAGIGKSRLTQEFLGGLGESATVLTGRCLPYGEGITYWPLVEILRQLGSEESVVQFLEGEREARTIVNTVFTAIGQAEAATSPEETPWAVRKLFEALAREQPLVVVLDDLHWAEPTFLDLVEHIADWSREAPILLLCSARPELLDERAGWGGGKHNATSILLEPLTEQDSDALIDNLLAGTELDTTVRARIGEAAEGNPLFVEQMLAMLGEEGSSAGGVAVPPTIQALLAARLDRLGNEERMAIERASIVGKEFWLRAVGALAPDPARATSALQRLVRKELIRPYRSPTFPADDSFRFRHILIRDEAYTGMPKELRAELHERFSEWLENERSEFDEIVGYHLEQAYRYRSELGPLDERARNLGRRAGERLGTAGERALGRYDMPAAAHLLERAVSVLPLDHPRRNRLQLGLGEAIVEAGDLVRATEVLDEVVRAAEATQNPRNAWRARVKLGWVRFLTLELSAEDGRALAEAAVAALTELEDEGGIARAWHLAAATRNAAGDSAATGAAMRQALVHARRAGDVHLVTETTFWVGAVTYFGATPVAEALAVCQELFDTASTPLLRAHARLSLGANQALAGHLGKGRGNITAARAMYAELGLKTLHGGTANAHGELELIAGEPVTAERILREGVEELEQIGEKGYRSTLLGQLAEALYVQRRYDEAEQVTRESQAVTAPDDATSLALWRRVRAKVVARRGELAEAERLAREAVTFIEPTDFLTEQGNVLMSLAEVLQLAGRPSEAHQTAERALALYEQKGAVPAVERTRVFISELVPA